MTGTTQKKRNVDQAEIGKFEAVAARWWDPDGEFKPLHRINPLRLDYIRQRCRIEGSATIDIGCGGGILSESLAAEGAIVTGVDATEGAIEVAKLHLLESGHEVEYQLATAEEYAETHAQQFDVLTCLEMLEHVPDPESVIAACSKLIKPGGDLFFSTINRNPKSYALMIVGAEYLLGMVPKGTHEYRKFIRPSELAGWCRDAGLIVEEITGMGYNPLTDRFSLSADVDVNYFVHCRRGIAS